MKTLQFCCLFAAMAITAGCVETEGSGSSGFRSTPRASSTPTTKWYEGGTLHQKSALEWQTASSQDKLATCADFVTKMWQNDDLKPAIANNLSVVDDVRPYAQQLVDFIDAAFKIDPDTEKNSMLFTNQEVSECAVIGMMTGGWTK